MASNESSKEEGGRGLGSMLLCDWSGFELGTQTGDPCNPGLAFYLGGIGTEVKVEPTTLF